MSRRFLGIIRIPAPYGTGPGSKYSLERERRRLDFARGHNNPRSYYRDKWNYGLTLMMVGLLLIVIGPLLLIGVFIDAGSGLNFVDWNGREWWGIFPPIIFMLGIFMNSRGEDILREIPGKWRKELGVED